jgi:hypothetical protein
MLRLALCLILLAGSATAEAIRFSPSDADFPNPERGWWLFAANDFGTATPGDIAAVAAICRPRY